MDRRDDGEVKKACSLAGHVASCYDYRRQVYTCVCGDRVVTELEREAYPHRVTPFIYSDE